MSSKKFLKIVLSIFVIVNFFSMANISITNYLADPLWLFSNQNKFNEKQDGFDERQQRTNYIYFKSEGKFDGILLGSSRATFVNQNDFVNMNIFNYSSNSMHAFEYKEYIDFAKKVKGEDLKYIIIGSDFYNTAIPKDVKFNKPNFYINNTTSSFYKYKMLFSYDLYLRSQEQIKKSTNNKSMYYDRNNVKYQHKVSEEERKKRYDITLKKHVQYFSYPNYELNNDYANILKIIKKENPNTKFIIYTSAVTADLLASIIKNANRWEDYKKWLYELIEVFGEVHHFMDINSITKNLENYPDDDHAYPFVLKLLANKISNFENKEIPEDFGIVLTKDNIEKYLKNLEKQIEKYDLKKF